jgi:peptidyl-prolyl cis-trans isomerase D
MGIMNKMRERMGIVLIILVFAFVITIVIDWGGGGVGTFMGERDHVGVVNGEKIRINEFYQVYNQVLEQYRDAGMELDAQNTEMALQQAWETAVNQILWEQEIERLGISITDEELFNYLEKNPPEFLKSQEVFLTDGEFDYQKYLDVLYNPQGNEWLEIEQYLRYDVLPYQKLNDMITTSVAVDEQELMRAYVEQYVDFKADYVAVPVNKIPDSLISVQDEELLAYYEENKETRFKKEEQRNLRYVYWLKVPSASDTADVLADLEDFRQRHAEGEDFNELAQIFSDNQDEAVSGDLGWLSRDELRREYRAPLSSGKKDEVLEPVIIGNEFHLIKLHDKRTRDGKEEYHIAVLIRVLDPVNTYDYYAAEAEAFALDAESYGFAKALESSEGKLDTVRGGYTREFPYFSKLGYFPTLAKWAYRSESKDLSPVFENENAFVVAELYSIDPETHIPFEDVRANVQRALLVQKKAARSRELTEKIHKACLRGEITMEDAVLQYPPSEYKSISFRLANPPHPFASAPAFKDVVRQLQESEISRVFPAGQYGSAFVRLTDRSEIDPEAFQARAAALRDMLVNEKQQAAYQKWMEHLRDKAVIKDYREEFGLN